jgi:hypothetical protein
VGTCVGGGGGGNQNTPDFSNPPRGIKSVVACAQAVLKQATNAGVLQVRSAAVIALRPSHPRRYPQVVSPASSEDAGVGMVALAVSQRGQV